MKHYKTYRGRPTKREKKINDRTIGIFLALFFFFAFLDMLTGNKISTEIKEVAVETKAEVSEIIFTKTKYFKNEVLAYQVAYAACEYHGFSGDNLKPCVMDLVGIAYAEHRNFGMTDGDSGKSRGLFQIHKGYHPEITDEQALDPYFSAKWTLARMINNGYKVDRDTAIMKHNGTPGISKTLAYLKTVNNYINQ